MALLPCVEIETNSAVSASVIWLHGLGANGHDFEDVVPALRLPQTLGVRFVFPHAPSIPVTINNGYVMPAWYDILEMSIDRKVDDVQLRQSAEQVRLLIQREIERGVPSERIVLAGFSQGGAVVYETALSYDQPLAGLMTMSTYLATQDSVKRHENNQHLPIFVMHGTQDPIVPFALGERARDALTAWQYDVSFRDYSMDHSVCIEQIRDVSTWLQKVLG